MHFPLSPLNAMLIFLGTFLFSIWLRRKKTLFISCFSLESLLVLLFMGISAAPVWADSTYYVTNRAVGTDTCVLGSNSTFGNGNLQGAIDCAVKSDEADTILIEGGNASGFTDSCGSPYTSMVNATYPGAFGIPWDPVGQNHPINIEGRSENWGSVGTLVDNAYDNIYSATWMNLNIPVTLDNNAREHYEGMPWVANIAVGFNVTGSNKVYGVPVTISNIQFAGQNIGIVIKGDSSYDATFHPNGAPSTISNSRVHGYGCGDECSTGQGQGVLFGHGISIYGGSKIFVIGNEISSNFDGVGVANSDTKPTFLHNVILYNKRNGIGARNDSSPIIGNYNSIGSVDSETNWIMANYIGIGCRDGSQPTIANNQIIGYNYFYFDRQAELPWLGRYLVEGCEPECLNYCEDRCQDDNSGGLCEAYCGSDRGKSCGERCAEDDEDVLVCQDYCEIERTQSCTVTCAGDTTHQICQDYCEISGAGTAAECVSLCAGDPDPYPQCQTYCAAARSQDCNVRCAGDSCDHAVCESYCDTLRTKPCDQVWCLLDTDHQVCEGYCESRAYEEGCIQGCWPGPPGYNKLGIGARDNSTPWIFGNSIEGNLWGGIGNTDFTEPQIGHEPVNPANPQFLTPGTTDFKRQNRVMRNSAEFRPSDDLCTTRVPIEGRAAIGSKDAAKPRIIGNFVQGNGWTGIGVKDWAAANITHNYLADNYIGISVAGAQSTSLTSAIIAYNTLRINRVAGIAVRDSGNSVYRIKINNNFVQGIPDAHSSGIGVDHSYAEILGNTVVEAGSAIQGELQQLSGGIGVRNGSDAIVRDNRVMRNGMGVVALGSRVVIENNLIAENWGTTEPTGIWLTDSSIGVRINNNIIIGNAFEDQYLPFRPVGLYNGWGILVQNDSKLYEARKNIIYNFEMGIDTQQEKGGVIEQGAVDYNLVMRETDPGNGVMDNSSQGENAYNLFFWDSVSGVYVKDYPGPHTHYLGARFGTNGSGTHFVNPGTDGDDNRDFRINSASLLATLANSDVYSDYIGVSSAFPQLLSLADVGVKFRRDFPAGYLTDSTVPTVTANSNIRMVKTSPGDGSTASGNTDIVVYLRDTGDGLVKDDIGITVTDDSGAVGYAGSITYEPSVVNTSSWFKVTFPPDRFLVGTVNVGVVAQDVQGGSLSADYSFQVGTDLYPPLLDGQEPPDLDTNVPPKPHIRFHIKDTSDGTASGTPQGGVDPSSIAVTITNNGNTKIFNSSPDEAGGERNVSGIIKNTDPTNTIIIYDPEDNFEYGTQVTVSVYAEDFAGSPLNTSYSFNIKQDDFPPEDVQAFHAVPMGTNGVFLEWIPSVDSEGDLQDQRIYYCDNWELDKQRFNCYGRGSQYYNWKFWGGVGSIVDSSFLNDLAVIIPNGSPYMFMLETIDDMNQRPDISEEFTTNPFGNDGAGPAATCYALERDNRWDCEAGSNYTNAQQAFEWLPGSQLIRARGSTASGKYTAAQLIVADYYPANFYFKFNFRLGSLQHGAYALLRHNKGGVVGNSGYIAFIDPVTGRMGFRILPDPVSREDGCDPCLDDSLIGAPTPVGLSAGTWYEVRISAYDSQFATEGDAVNLRMEVWQGSTKLATTMAYESRYRIGEIGFYEPGDSCNQLGYTDYDSVSIEWYGVFTDDWVTVRGGYFKDNFEGFKDDFGGDLTEWTINGNASWSNLSGELVSGGGGGDLVAFGFRPRKYFQAAVGINLEIVSDDNAYILFRRQYQADVGESGYAAAVEYDGVEASLGFYKYSLSGFEALTPFETVTVGQGIYTMRVEVEGDSFELWLENGASQVGNKVITSDGDYSGGMAGLFRWNKTSDTMVYDDFRINDLITTESSDWELAGGTDWDITLDTPFRMENKSGAPGSEVLVKDLILHDSFMFEGDMTIDGSTGDGAGFYFQKQSGAAAGRDAYGLILKIDPDGYNGDGNNVYFFRLGSDGNIYHDTSVPNLLTTFGDYDITTGNRIHVKIMGTAAGFPNSEGIFNDISYRFEAYLSTTSEKPYNYSFVAGSQDTGQVIMAWDEIESAYEVSSSGFYLGGKAGFYIPDPNAFDFNNPLYNVSQPANAVSVDNVAIGMVENFVIPRVETGSQSVTVFTGDGDPGGYSSQQVFDTLQASIDNIAVGTCGDEFIQLGPYNYNIGESVLNVKDCVAIRGAGMDNTTIEGSGPMIVLISQFTDNVSLEDLTIYGDGNNTGIWMADSSPMIMGVSVGNCYDGIRIGGGLHDPENYPARPTITASIIKGNNHIGIGNNIASQAWILNNQISQNAWNGIGVLDQSTPRIEDNIIGTSGDDAQQWSEGNANMGIGVNDNSAPTIVGNTIKNNNIGGIGIRGNATPNIFYNTIASNIYGVLAYEYAEPLIYNNIMRNNISFGNSAQDSVIWEVKYNEVSNNTSGISMREDAQGLIEGNYVYSNSTDEAVAVFEDAGISARGGADTSVFNNWVVDNGSKGIAFMETPAESHILIQYNYVANNATGSDTTGNPGIGVINNTDGNVALNYGYFTVTNNVIKQNQDGGAAFGNFGGTLLFQDNFLVNNTVFTKTPTHKVVGGIGLYGLNSATILINNNTIKNNTGVVAGGIGISFANNNSNISVSGNYIYSNETQATGHTGGGASFREVDDSNVVFQNNVVSSNTVLDVTSDHKAVGGVGFYLLKNASTVSVTGNTVRNNEGTYVGGIGVTLANSGTDVSINNNKVYWNHAEGDVGYSVGGIGILDSEGDFYISDNVIHSNDTEATPRTGGIGVRWLQNFTVANPTAVAGKLQILNNTVYSHRFYQADAESRLTALAAVNDAVCGLSDQYANSPDPTKGLEEVKNELVSQYGASGIRVRNVSFGNSGLLISGNNVYNNTNGILMLGESAWGVTGDVSLANNTVKSTRFNGIVVWAQLSQYPTYVFSNKLNNAGIVENGWAGIRVREVSENIHVKGNSVVNFGHSGIRINTVANDNSASETSVTIEDNTVRNSLCGTGISLNTITFANVTIYSNFIHSNYNPKTMHGFTPDDGGISISTIQNDTNITISSNTVNRNSAGVAAQNGGIGGIGFFNMVDSASNINIILDNNSILSNSGFAGGGIGFTFTNVNANISVINNTVYSNSCFGDTRGIGGIGFMTPAISAAKSVNITVDNNTIKNNKGIVGGGVGFTNINYNVSLVNNTVENNFTQSQQQGTGGIGFLIFLDGAATVTIENNRIYSNTGFKGGGIGFTNINGKLWLKDNRIVSNIGPDNYDNVGGVGFLDSTGGSPADVTFENNTIRNNIGYLGGGVGFTGVNAVITFTNNTIGNNESKSTLKGVGGIGLLDSAGSVYIDNNYIYSNLTNAVQFGDQ